jgi:hypothetical protein
MRSVKGLSRISETDLRMSYSNAFGLIFTGFTGCMIINSAINVIDFLSSVPARRKIRISRGNKKRKSNELFIDYFLDVFDLGSLKSSLGFLSSSLYSRLAVPSFSTFALKIFPSLPFAASLIQAGALFGTGTRSLLPLK